MRLTGWTWLFCGILVSVVSGYVYLFVPKDGGPNRGMAFFFFIGIIFIITAIVKIMFKKVDDKEVFDSVEKSIEKKKEPMMQIPIGENRQNKIDAAINGMASNMNNQQHPRNNASNHTNTYYQMHHYKGPAHTPTQAIHSQHPIAQHQAHSHIQNSEHGLKCHRCGNVNAGHANYCHSCGNRLR